MDSFSDDEALARKEDCDEELEVERKKKEVINSKEKENKVKCELVENLEKLKEAMKENRENMEADLRQAYEYVKGTGEESKIEDIGKMYVKYWEDNISTRIEYVKETGKTETELGENMIEKGIWTRKR